MKNLDLLLDSYDYELNKSFIADRPVAGRHHSKLLVYNVQTNEVVHTNFLELDKYLPENSTLVMNQTKVFPCRLLGQKETGGKVEVFFLSLIAKDGFYPALVRTRSKKKIGDTFHFGELIVKIEDLGEEGSFIVSVNQDHNSLIDLLKKHAQIPIPPYIRGGIADEKDLEDYQTTYAKELGSVAAPTAGLHFTKEVFSKLEKKNVTKAFVTLHVGAGTFKPVMTENIKDHNMHSEIYDIDDDNLNKLNSASKVFAVGTTSLRVLESSYKKGLFKLPPIELKPYSTNIFLHPGVEVNSIDGLITNFHLPKSSLLMLVSSLIGREKTLELYEIAKQENYRFFSYGDAMLIIR
jgi:S-adenosylmethionine:tRNA ribosyltransferase-isomerase